MTEWFVVCRVGIVMPTLFFPKLTRVVSAYRKSIGYYPTVARIFSGAK